MPDVSKYQPGDMFFDKNTGFIYVLSNFQPLLKDELAYRLVRAYRYGKPAKGRFIQYFEHKQLDKMIKTASPQTVKILFGETKQWLNTK